MEGSLYLEFLINRYLSGWENLALDLQSGSINSDFRRYMRTNKRKLTLSQQIEIAESERKTVEEVIPLFLETYYDNGGTKLQGFQEELDNWRKCLTSHPLVGETSISAYISEFSKAIKEEHDNDSRKIEAEEKLTHLIMLMQQYSQWIENDK